MQPNFSTTLTESDSEQRVNDQPVLSLSQIIHIFWLHRYVFISVTILITLLSGIALFQLTPLYTAESKLLLGLTRSKIVDVDAVLSGDINNDNAIKSEIEILNSRELAKKVIRQLNLTEMTEFNPPPVQHWFNELNIVNQSIQIAKDFLQINEIDAVLSEEEKKQRLLAQVTDRYLNKIKISPVRGSQVINISIEISDPKLAAQIANAHAESYIMDRLEAKFEATRKATTWLNDQLSDLRAKVVNSEKAVENYRSEHNLTRGTSETGLLREQVSEINNQLVIAKASKAEASARLNQVKQLLINGTEIESVSEVLSSPLIQSLREQESILTRKMSEMSVEYGEKHPQMIRINAEKNDLQAKIKIEIKKIAAGLQNELNIASSRELSLQNSLQMIEAKSNVNNKQEVQLHALEREANANKVLFETFLTRFKETSSTQGIEEADARIISAAEIPLMPSFPKKNLLMILIILMAMMVASGIIFLIELLNPGLRSPEEIQSFLGLPTLGLLPSTAQKYNPADYLLQKPQSHLSEAINSLRVSLLLANVDNPIKTVLISSSIPNEGKSTLALCLARSAAKSGQKVLLIDTDLRRPSIEKKIGIELREQGLVDLLLAKEANIAEFIFQESKSGLWIMSKGKTDVVSSTDLLTSHRMEKLIADSKKEFDLVIFDSPPVMPVTDARALAPLVDKTLFVIHWNETPRKVIKAGLQQIQMSTPIPVGIVLQQVNLKRYGNHRYGDSGYHYYYYKYGKYYHN